MMESSWTKKLNIRRNRTFAFVKLWRENAAKEVGRDKGGRTPSDDDLLCRYCLALLCWGDGMHNVGMATNHMASCHGRTITAEDIETARATFAFVKLWRENAFPSLFQMPTFVRNPPRATPKPWAFPFHHAHSTPQTG